MVVCGARYRRLAVLGWMAALTACGGAAPQVPDGTPADVAARSLVADAAAEAGAARPIVVFATADWCEPCNELHHRFVDTAEGVAALKPAVVREIDVDASTGHAVAAQWHVLGYPTTLVLRQTAAGLHEIGRIEGFDAVADYKQALHELLGRTAPAPGLCPPGAPVVFAASDPTATTAAVQCAAELLKGDQAAAAADALEHISRDPNHLQAAAQWPEPARKSLLASLRLLGRHQARVAHDHAACAQTFERLSQWSGTPRASQPGLLFWRAKCTLRGGRPDLAQQQWQAYLAGAGNNADGRELVADFIVHEALGQPWGPPWAQQLLTQLLADQPHNHWAHYLLATLLTKTGEVAQVRQQLDLALADKPDSALYLRHRQRLATP